ncbi:MAG: DUF4340 domain-containing protein, partial [Eubacteriales bacterium]|nr:DUF4340 domain-containing protein [Eubacteriales bacterium]
MTKKGLAVLIVLAVIVAGAIGGTIIFLRQQEIADMANEAAQQTEKINLSDARDMTITYIKLEDNDSVLELERGSDGAWTMSGSEAEIDQAAAQDISASLSDIVLSQAIDIGSEPLSTYGLDPGDLIATYTTAEGTYICYFGKYTSDKSAVFFRKSSDDMVYTIETQSFDGIRNGFDSLIEKIIEMPDTDTIGYAAFKTADTAETVLQRADDAYTSVPWVMVSPITLPLSGDAYTLFLECLDIRTLTDYVESAALSDHGIDGETWLEYRDEAGSVLMHIDIGEKTADSMVYCSIGESVFLVPEAVRDMAVRDAFSLIDQRLLPVDDTSLIDTLTIVRGEEQAVLALSDGGYTLNTESITTEQAAALYERLGAVSFSGEAAEKVGSLLYGTIFAVLTDGTEISMEIYPYLKDYYAVDYG